MTDLDLWEQNLHGIGALRQYLQINDQNKAIPLYYGNMAWSGKIAKHGVRSRIVYHDIGHMLHAIATGQPERVFRPEFGHPFGAFSLVVARAELRVCLFTQLVFGAELQPRQMGMGNEHPDRVLEAHLRSIDCGQVGRGVSSADELAKAQRWVARFDIDALVQQLICLGKIAKHNREQSSDHHCEKEWVR